MEVLSPSATSVAAWPLQNQVTGSFRLLEYFQNSDFLLLLPPVLLWDKKININHFCGRAHHIKCRGGEG